ncbi:hypothetical protein [Catenulispora pinisilvae]|uniref:hypothetical protein n=1 Tax=Catenulispora pinisilvae TaxID=2705253 RepID=UPI001891A0D2|nr:hypothetical protein [Catenulispora pinisilvae]
MLLSAAGCSSSNTSGLKVASVTAAAAKVGDSGTTCPLIFDKAAVLKTAGIPGTLAPSSDPSKIASGDDGTKASPGSPMAVRGGGGVITCGFEIAVNGSTTDVTVMLVAVNSGTASGILIPSLASKTQLANAQLEPMLSAPIPVGSARLAPGPGVAALGHVKVQGNGDAALLVSVDGTGAPSIAGDPLEKFTTALTSKIRA